MGVVIAFFILVALFSLPQPVQPQAQTGGAKWLLLTLLVGIGLGIIIWKIQGKI
jgi:hypothetical protein